MSTSANKAATAKRIGKLVRMFSSPFEQEAITALVKMRRLMAEEKQSFNDLAAQIEQGVEQGVDKGTKQANGQVLSKQFFDSDGEPRWLEIARFCDANPGKSALKANEQEFIEEMQIKLRYRQPTRPMGGFLLSIFWKLGGSFKEKRDHE